MERDFEEAPPSRGKCKEYFKKEKHSYRECSSCPENCQIKFFFLFKLSLTTDNFNDYLEDIELYMSVFVNSYLLFVPKNPIPCERGVFLLRL